MRRRSGMKRNPDGRKSCRSRSLVRKRKSCCHRRSYGIEMSCKKKDLTKVGCEVRSRGQAGIRSQERSRVQLEEVGQARV